MFGCRSLPLPMTYINYFMASFCIYFCTWGVLFSYSAEQYNISITATGVPTSGEEYTLTCSVNVSAGTPSIQWQYHNGNVVATGGDITVGSPQPSGTTTTLTLTFNPLHTSHGGEYICRSVVQGTVERTAMVDVTVQSEYQR